MRHAQEGDTAQPDRKTPGPENQPSPLQTQAREQRERSLPVIATPQGDIVTFINLTQRSQRTPFDMYRNRGSAPPQHQPQPNPYRFTLRSLGLTEQEFEDKIEQEIEELFQEIETERRQTLLENIPMGCALTKADCRNLFRGNPPSGSLLGVFNCAYDIDIVYHSEEAPNVSDAC